MPISREEFGERLVNTRRRMEKGDLNALIAYSNCKLPGNVQYLSNYAPMAAGYQSIGAFDTVIWGDTTCVVQMEGEPVLLTNCPWIAPQIKDITTLTDIRVTFDYAKLISEVLPNTEMKIGIDGWGMFPAPVYERLTTLLPKATFRECMILEELRMVKSPPEIALMRKASKLVVEGVNAGIRAIKRGVTELQVTRAIESTMERGNPVYGGYDNQTAALSLVGSGVRTSIGGVAPLPTNKKIKKGDLVVMDVCAEYEGYAGDISRGKVLGKPSKEQRDLFEAVMQVQQACLKTIRPGARSKDLQDTANRVGRELGYGEYVVPLVTHGMGLEIHERPDAGVEETVLAPNMVISCEPAICTPKLGLRIEDTVRVTDTGYEILTKCQKTLEL
jgi:Xaa-Pro dipeptidase